MVNFNPHNWYWLSESGDLYSSRRQVITTEADEEYQAWLAAGMGSAQIWPRDDNGDQTKRALQDVLATYGLFIDLVAYAKNARWQREQGGTTVSGMMVATDDRSKQMIMGARIAADKDANFATPWATADDEVVNLGAAQIIAISDAVMAHVQDCFVRFADVQAGISAGTITTREQVDAAFSE